jgi:hypothetical protein
MSFQTRDDKVRRRLECQNSMVCDWVIAVCLSEARERVLIQDSTGLGKMTWINGIAKFFDSVEYMNVWMSGYLDIWISGCIDGFQFKIVMENDETKRCKQITKLLIRQTL